MTPEQRAERVLREAYAGVDRLAPDARENLAQAVASQIHTAVAEERAACARLAESDRGRDSYLGGYSVRDVQSVAGKRIAAAIRARSNKPARDQP